MSARSPDELADDGQDGDAAVVSRLLGIAGLGQHDDRAGLPARGGDAVLHDVVGHVGERLVHLLVGKHKELSSQALAVGRLVVLQLVGRLCNLGGLERFVVPGVLVLGAAVGVTLGVQVLHDAAVSLLLLLVELLVELGLVALVVVQGSGRLAERLADVLGCRGLFSGRRVDHRLDDGGRVALASAEALEVVPEALRVGVLVVDQVHLPLALQLLLLALDGVLDLLALGLVLEERAGELVGVADVGSSVVGLGGLLDHLAAQFFSLLLQLGHLLVVPLVVASRLAGRPHTRLGVRHALAHGLLEAPDEAEVDLVDGLLFVGLLVFEQLGQLVGPAVELLAARLAVLVDGRLVAVDEQVEVGSQLLLAGLGVDRLGVLLVVDDNVGQVGLDDLVVAAGSVR